MEAIAWAALGFMLGGIAGWKVALWSAASVVHDALRDGKFVKAN